MSARGRLTVIDLDHERLSFVSGTVSPGRVRIASRGSAARPRDVDAADAQALGRWVGEQLASSGCGVSGRVQVCVPRGNVVMKRLSFPGVESEADPDLVAMVRLQMTRQMPMKVEGTSIDFIPLARAGPVGSGGGGNGSSSGTPEGPGFEVLACALPGDRVAWCRGVVEGAGLRLSSLSLRASGAATLAAQAGIGAESGVMVISIGWSSVEFVVVHEGAIVFVRSADVPLTDGDDASQYADRVAVEAKRTWMAYRVSPGSSEIGAVVAVGSGPLAKAVSARSGEALGIASSMVEIPGFVEDESAVVEGEGVGDGTGLGEAALAPLVGLMVAHASDQAVFDFAHPRRAPDTKAGTRRMALLGVLGVIVVIGGGVVLADMRVRQTQREVARAKQEATEWGMRVVDHLRADARMRHLDQWLSADVDWVAHWSKISQTMPAPPEALLDSLDGSLTRAEVVFAPEGSGSSRRYTEQGWNLEMQAVLHATGRHSSRVVGNQFRERLVSDPAYVVESRGADTEHRFDMDLVTRRSTPDDAPAGAPALGSSSRAGDRGSTRTAAADERQGGTP